MANGKLTTLNRPAYDYDTLDKTSCKGERTRGIQNRSGIEILIASLDEAVQVSSSVVTSGTSYGGRGGDHRPRYV